MNLDLKSWEAWYAAHEDAIIEDFLTFLRFQSIGTDAAYDTHTRSCAKWLVNYLSTIGLEATLIETSGQPIVYATDLRAGQGRPTLMLYHHYDVQPVDPLDLWESPPFDPAIREGNVFARGAQDNKGQCFYTLTALKALYQLTQTLPFNLKLFIEGEEESGSEGTKEALLKDPKKWKADSLLAIDTDMGGIGKGAITVGLRGLVTAEICLRAANSDMHSGSMGGIAYNPIRALCDLLATCFDAQGRVAIEHFYDAVDPITEQVRAALDLELDEEQIVEEFGLRVLGREPGYTIGEAVSLRPTFEINGIQGGYSGEGFKTVLPAVARAKVSCRLVAAQDPDAIARHLEAHLHSHLKEGIEMSLTICQKASAFRSQSDSEIAKRAASAYEEVLAVPCKKIVCGGSIPIVSDLAKLSGAEVVIMGFGLGTDRVHAPNEHFSLGRLRQGFLTIGRIFASYYD